MTVKRITSERGIRNLRTAARCYWRCDTQVGIEIIDPSIPTRQVYAHPRNAPTGVKVGDVGEVRFEMQSGLLEPVFVVK
jgi:hypothetical protein